MSWASGLATGYTGTHDPGLPSVAGKRENKADWRSKNIFYKYGDMLLPVSMSNAA